MIDSAEAGPGVTRFDLVCHDGVVEAALALTETWAEDRALSDIARARLASLTRAALTHGLRFDPRGVSLFVRWLDLQRVRVDVRWVGCSGTARTVTASRDVAATISTLDSLADEWGVGVSGSNWVQWMVADTG